MAPRPTDGPLERREGPDDIVLGFRTIQSGVMGRLVRMGPAADEILSRHAYPEPVAELLGQGLVLAVLLGAPLREGAKLILQTKTDGPVRFLVVQYESPGRLRGYASFDSAEIERRMAAGPVEQRDLLGTGHLAMTIDPGGDHDRHQGIVGLDGESLATAALTYFRQSEQLPTYLRLAVARQFRAGGSGRPGTWAWRAGGILVQHLSPLGGTPPAPKDGEELPMLGEDDDHWLRVRLLAETTEDHELTDPTLAPDDLLLRLFHEEGVVRAREPVTILPLCRCSRERVETLLKSFGPEEIADMGEDDGQISVTCEFCNSRYRFAPSELV